MQQIGCFISPHGYGHATRAIGVLEALQSRHPDLHIHIFTTVPESLFRQSLAHITYHKVTTDIGLVQTSALEADIPATIARLDTFLPYSDTLINDLGKHCRHCLFILCDIAPLGIAVAKKIGVPSILVENFTWNWIYTPYCQRYPELKKHASALKSQFEQADYHIQTEPLCQKKLADLSCGPIFRTIRQNATTIRRQLGCDTKKIILLTMGGVTQKYPLWKNLDQFSDCFFVFTGQPETQRRGENILLLDRFSELYHPDLIAAADIVVCKAGYSTIAECYQAGARIIAVGRDDFPETAPLQNYIQNILAGVTIDAENFLTGHWLSLLPELLLQTRPSQAVPNGGDIVASFLSSLL